MRTIPSLFPRLRLAALGLSLMAIAPALLAAETEKKNDKGPMKADTFSGLEMRGIGPAMVSGRIADLAVNTKDKSTWYVAAASGGLWKTINAGTTWKPIFDDQGSYSLGCVTIDPNNPLVIWLGSGENNSQRSVSYGDGVYRSLDGGTTWQNMGLKQSEHISQIVVDPRDSNVVWVAAQGPLWSAGGDRGLFVTRDAGKTWSKAFETSENTGVTEVHLDPRDADVMLASTDQRRTRIGPAQIYRCWQDLAQDQQWFAEG